MINYIVGDTDVLVGQVLNVIQDLSDNIDVTIPGPVGFDGAPAYQFINTSDFTCTLAPRAGEIGGAASYDLLTQTSISLIPDGSGQWLFESSFNPGDGASVAMETPTGDVDGMNTDFVFTAPPIQVFRNGVMELRLGTVSTNTFTFDTPPEVGDDVEGLV